MDKNYETSSELELERLKSEEEDSLSSPPEYRILTYPADFTIEVLYNKIKSDDIEIPKFQRKFVWNQAKASKLIESFLLGLPVPPVFLYSESSTKKLLVIDGQQRLKSIYYFIHGYFGEEKKGKKNIFFLKNLNEKSKWCNGRFENFSEEEKRDFANKVLRAFIVEQIDPKDNTSVYHIFERLNTGGTLLNNQEIRNCLYHGELNDLLIRLNEIKEWRFIVGKPTPDNRRRDVELILRFLSLYKNFSNYEKPLKEFMNNFMGNNRNPKKEDLAEIKRIFTTTCQKIITSLGERPFHIRAGLNTAVFDSIFVNFARYIEKIPNDIKERFQRLIEDQDYYKYTRDATTDIKVIRERFAISEKILFS